MLIKLSSQCHVAHDCISEVKVNHDAGTITVRTKDGIGHCVTPDYKQGLYEFRDQLVAQINAAGAPNA